MRDRQISRTSLLERPARAPVPGHGIAASAPVHRYGVAASAPGQRPGGAATLPVHARRLPLPLLLLVLAIGCGAGGNDEPAISPQERTVVSQTGPVPAAGMAWVIFGADTVHVEVARTAEQRQRGLMYREEVPEGTGMLFVFPDSQIRSFWMQNTLVALDIAFLDADLRIVDIQQMEPQSEDFHDSRAPAMFALEVPQGWFESKGIRVGARPEVVFGPM